MKLNEKSCQVNADFHSFHKFGHRILDESNKFHPMAWWPFWNLSHLCESNIDQISIQFFFAGRSGTFLPSDNIYVSSTSLYNFIWKALIISSWSVLTVISTHYFHLFIFMFIYLLGVGINLSWGDISSLFSSETPFHVSLNW